MTKPHTISIAAPGCTKEQSDKLAELTNTIHQNEQFVQDNFGPADLDDWRRIFRNLLDWYDGEDDDDAPLHQVILPDDYDKMNLMLKAMNERAAAQLQLSQVIQDIFTHNC